MNSIVPRPFRDVANDLMQIRQGTVREHHEVDNTTTLHIKGKAHRGATHLTKTLLRVAATAMGVFATMHFGWAPLTAAAMGTFLSLPSVLLLGGGLLLKYAGTAATAALATGKIAAIGDMLITFLGAWVVLEHHDDSKFGFGEPFLNRMSAAIEPYIAKGLGTVLSNRTVTVPDVA